MPSEAGVPFQRTELVILPVTGLTGVGDGTGALTLVDTLVLGYVYYIEKLRFLSSMIATGGSATQTFKIRRGGATGAVLASLTLALTDVNAVGKFKSANVAAADDSNARISDLVGISLTRDAGGTAFTALAGTFLLSLRQRNQARV